MNTTVALVKAFLEGRVLSIKTAFRDFGITNLPRECSRLIEKKFGVELSRVRRCGKSRFGVRVSWFEYRLPDTEYNAAGRKKMVDYLQQQLNIEKKKEESLKHSSRTEQLDIFN